MSWVFIGNGSIAIFFVELDYDGTRPAFSVLLLSTFPVDVDSLPQQPLCPFTAGTQNSPLVSEHPMDTCFARSTGDP